MLIKKSHTVNYMHIYTVIVFFVTDGIVRALAEIKTDIGAIKREVAALRTLIVHRDQHDTTEKNMQCVLPVSNDEELKQLEMELQTKEKQKILVCIYLTFSLISSSY